jgi:hypothetical protein
MVDRRRNVIALSGRAGAVDGQAPHQEILWAAVGQLDQLTDRARQFSPQAAWTAQQWMIATTPFRLRLAIGRRGLSDLAMICAGSEQACDRWALELNDARRDVERRLRDIAVCLNALQRPDTSPADRYQQTEVFISARSALLEALADVRGIAAQWPPAELGAG